MNFFLLKEWLIYFHQQTDEHSLHSPYFYDLFTKLIKPDLSAKYPQSGIESDRAHFLKSTAHITFNDLGAGSKHASGSTRNVSEIAKHSTSSKKFSMLLLAIIENYQFKNVVELGTSLGINTAYMVQAANCNITTFEGVPALVELAKTHLIKYPNVEIIAGNINDRLPQFLSKLSHKIDLSYIDANHTYLATMHYFELLINHHHEQAIMVFDDIHWSKDMKRAWEEIKQHPLVTASIDLFDAGFIFFNTSFSKHHYVLRF